jgi:hypothetical protein
VIPGGAVYIVGTDRLERNERMNSFTNVTFDEISVGQSLTVSRTLSRTDIEALTFVSGGGGAFSDWAAQRDGLG